MTELLVISFQWLFFAYLITLNLGYIALNISSLFYVLKYMQESEFENFIGLSPDFMPPISILVPAYNEEINVEATVRSLMQLEYPEFEIIVINDGSKDKTMQKLISAFSLQLFPEAYRIRISVKPVREIYCSANYSNLRVINKENGGKADALNAGLNACRYPLYCCVDADSILQRDSLKRVVKPFVEDSRTVASGGIIRIANGCKVSGGFLTQVGLPGNFLALIQVVEYLRAFLFGRLGWAQFNALLIISGAFGVFHKETVIAAGAYRVGTVGEDMDLVVRLHRYLRKKKVPYRITFVPDPVCWTEAPEDWSTLRNQRIRWQQGLGESLTSNISLMFNLKAGMTGMFAFPFMFIFELFGPIIEICGYLFIFLGFIFDFISWNSFVAFFMLSFSLGMLVSVMAFLLEELTFRLYKGVKESLLLLGMAIIENLGYRQLIGVLRLIGLYRWLGGTKGKWGVMNRTARWQQNV